MEFPGVAVITGAGGSGIGAAVAEAFVRGGCTRLAITDINASTLATTQEVLQSISAGVQVLVSVGDISSEEFVNSFLKSVSERFGRVDYAVNCAGILGSIASRSTETPLATFQRINDVNYKGCWLSSRAEIAQMLQQEPLPQSPLHRGSIVNMASQLGIVARPGAAAYCASKAAIINMTRADAIDYSGDGIRLNCVCPGIIATPMTKASAEMDDALQEKILQTPLKRAGTAKEVADAVLFLCSNKATFIQGHALVVDGGYTIA